MIGIEITTITMTITTDLTRPTDASPFGSVCSASTSFSENLRVFQRSIKLQRVMAQFETEPLPQPEAYCFW
jgi:hypothetical protein